MPQSDAVLSFGDAIAVDHQAGDRYARQPIARPALGTRSILTAIRREYAMRSTAVIIPPLGLRSVVASSAETGSRPAVMPGLVQRIRAGLSACCRIA